MRCTVVVTLRSLTSKVPRSPNLRPSQRGSGPPFVTPCFESVSGSCKWDSRILGWAAIQSEFRGCEALWEATPHSARYSRHPLPKGEGRNQSTLTALSLGERVARSRRSHQPVRDG